MKRAKAKTTAKAVLAIMGLPGRSKSGSDTEWLLGAEDDMESAGKGPKALAIAVTTLHIMAKETAAIPTGKSLSDQHVRQWMIKIALHKAAIEIGAPFPSVAMHYLIEKINEWGVTLAETARQLLKRGELPDNYAQKEKS